MLNKILESISDARQTVIDLQRLLVAIPALGPDAGGQGEKDKAEALKTQLAAFGFPAPFEMRAPDPRTACGYRPSLSYIIPGEDPSRTFWILAHLDVVAAGNLAQWKTNPFDLAVEGDFLIGRGVEDNHQGLVGAVLLGKALLDNKATPPMNLGLLFIADEESGNKFGLDYVLRHHADLFKKNDLFLVPDSGDSAGGSIEIAEKSMIWLKVTMTGKQCHGSMPELGRNTLKAAADFIMRLPQLEAAFSEENPLFEPPRSTFEPTKIEANVESVNIIPGHGVFYVDCRVLPSYDLGDVMKIFEKIGKEIERAHGLEVSLETVQHVQAPPATPAEAEIIARLIPAIEAVNNVTPKLIGIGGGTLAALLRQQGFEAAVWATLLDNAHQPNEHSSLPATLGDAKIMARALWGKA